MVRSIRPMPLVRVLLVDHIATDGEAFFQLACQHDLEGIVAKWARGTYRMDGRGTSWLKIKNPDYTQMDGRQALFEQRRAGRVKRREAPPRLVLS